MSDEETPFTHRQNYAELKRIFMAQGHGADAAEVRACIVGLASSVSGLANAIELLATGDPHDFDIEQIVLNAKQSSGAAVSLVFGIPDAA